MTPEMLEDTGKLKLIGDNVITLSNVLSLASYLFNALSDHEIDKTTNNGTKTMSGELITELGASRIKRNILESVGAR